MQGQEKSQNFIQKAAVLYLIIWTISPPLEIDMIYRLLGLGCAAIWFLVALRRGLWVEKVHIYAVVYMFLVILIAYLEKGSFDAIIRQIGIYILVICFIIHCFYKENGWHELSGIIPIVLILLLIYNWRTAEILLEDPTIARKLVRADESVYEYLRQGIGGYSLVYPQVCIFPAILAWILRAYHNNKIYFGIGCIWLYTYILCISRAGYSIAIFASIVGAIMLFFYRGRNIWIAFAIAAVIFMAVMGAILYVDGFREYLLQTFDGTAVAKKINDLVATSETGVAEGSIYERVQTYKNSMNTILEYPLVGSLWMGSGGGHSAILDQFAKYGVWGGVIYTMMLFTVPNEYKRHFHNPQVWAVSNAVMVSILFVALLDSFSYSFTCMILLMLPLLYEDILRWEEIEA